MGARPSSWSVSGAAVRKVMRSQRPLASGPCEEGAASEPFGVHGVRQVEVADVADVLDVLQKNRDDAAAEVQQIDRAVVDESRERKVAGNRFSGVAAHDDLFAGGRHTFADCRMRVAIAAKKVQQG